MTMGQADRKAMRVRAVTDPDTSPEIEAVKAAFDTRPGWWRRHRARLGVILGIVATVAGGGYAVGHYVSGSEAETTEQAKLVVKIDSFAERLSRIEGQLEIIITRLPEAP